MNRKVLVVGAAVVLPLLGVLLANIRRDPSTVRSPLVGRAAPPFRLSPVGGGPPVTLDSLRGRPVVINFWATWCGPCIQEHEVLQQAARATAGRVQFLGIVYEDEEDRVREFLLARGGAYPAILDRDGGTAIAYGVAGVPETYFIDAAGRVAFKYGLPLDEVTMREGLRLIAPDQVTEAR